MALSPHTLAQARLFEAVAKGDIPAMDRALEGGAHINAPLLIGELVSIGQKASDYPAAQHRKTPLQVAIEQNPGYTAGIHHLLARGANPNQSDDQGNNPLSAALAYPHPGPLNELLKKGVDVTGVDAQGRTTLQQAIAQSPELVGHLLVHQASPLQMGRFGQSALHDVASDLSLSPGQRQRLIGKMMTSPLVAGVFSSLRNADGQTPTDLLRESDPQLLQEVREDLSRRCLMMPAVPKGLQSHSLADIQAALLQGQVRVVVRNGEAQPLPMNASTPESSAPRASLGGRLRAAIVERAALRAEPEPQPEMASVAPGQARKLGR